ncbi:tetratricopeptide repeat protein [Streptomyces sp. NPDC006458]|uniref:tetratricopeptide repeat protein n=1 Tax=Streptomyces sp. NPDC006458 TaxID=3154302 RepID=UPI0033A518DF
MSRPTFQANAFQDTLLGLEFTPDPDRPADLFSRACAEEFAHMRLDRFGYLLAQVFEPNVLLEAALLTDLPYESVADLSHRPTESMTRLAELADQAADLPVVAVVNVASALISVSRFDIAARLLVDAYSRATTPREAFEAAMLSFVVTNRRDDGTDSPRQFHRMRTAAETREVPDNRVLDACSQAVVWYLKRKELPESEYRWFLDTGTRLAEARDRLDPGAVSSWYRALAMVPAAEGSAATTRRYMEYAREAAEDTMARRPRAYETHFLKTYHESSLKEHMYLTRDLDRAEEAGRALIALDPSWAPSYGELAEAYVVFGRTEQAAELYEQAVAAGPPYVGHHMLRAARCHQRAGNTHRALTLHRDLSHLAPHDEDVLRTGLDLARDLADGDSRAHFEAALERIKTGSARHRGMDGEDR